MSSRSNPMFDSYEIPFCLSGASDHEISELASQVGLFMLGWQKLELNLRILVLRTGRFDTPSLPMYEATGRFAEAVIRAVLKHDKDLYDRLLELNEFRNLIVHGVTQKLISEDPKKRLLFVHQDVWAVQGVQKQLRDWGSSFSTRDSEGFSKWIKQIASTRLYLSDFPNLRADLKAVNLRVEALLRSTNREVNQ